MVHSPEHPGASMTDSGAAHRITGSDILARVARARSRLDWGRMALAARGCLLTLAVAIVFDQLARHGMPIAYPFAFLLVTVVYAASDGGLLVGMFSAGFMLLYAAHFLATPGATPRYSPESAYTLVAFTLIVPTTVLLVVRMRDAVLRARAVELSRAEAERLDRRLSFLAEANRRLAASLDHKTTLRNLARLIVPTLADWCAIHVVSEQGSLQFVAGAHRDPAKDLLVRALCEYETHHQPFGSATERGSYGGVTEDVLRANAQDGEQLKLYRALAAASFLRVPMLAQGRVVGLV